MGQNYAPGSTQDLKITTVQRIGVLTCGKVDYLDEVPCGSIIALGGVDKFFIKQGTISGSEDVYPIRTMKHSVSPVIRVSVEPKNVAELPKLLEGLRRLSRYDPLVICTTEESGQHIISGVNELHIKNCLKELQNEYPRCDISASDPFVIYKETVTDLSS